MAKTQFETNLKNVSSMFASIKEILSERELIVKQHIAETYRADVEKCHTRQLQIDQTR